jgi:iron complex outermembrane receptor protein
MRLLVTGSLAVCVAAGLVLPAAAVGADGPDALEEITVSARKFSERLQDSPVAVTAFSAEALEARSIVNSGDVLSFVPNVNVGAGYSGGSEGFIYIRGVGVNDFTAALDPPVGVYVDGVFLGRTAGALFDLVDTDTIEVLRGPQGTLFGRNTSGGALNVTSRRAAHEWQGSVALTAGQRDLYGGRALLNVPILTDVLAARIAVLKRVQDGWVTRQGDGRTLGDVDTTAARLSIEWTPSTNVSARLAADYSDSSNTPQPSMLRDSVVGATSPCPPFCVPFPADLQSYATSSLESSNAAQPLIFDVKTSGVALTVDWQTGDTSLKSITAYRQVEQLSLADYDGTPYYFYEDEVPLDQNQLSQEFQLSGNALDSRMRWLAGVFYFKEEIDQTNAISLGTTGPRGVISAPVLVPPFPGGPPILPVAPLVVDPPAPFDRRYRIVSRQRILPTTEAYAVFGQLDFELTDRLNGTVGLRWSRDNKTQDYDFLTDNTIANHPLYPLGRTPALQTSINDSWQSTDPRVGLDYKLTERITTYVSYATGFRAGGFNSRPVVLPVTTFDPEEVRTTELGVKSESLDRMWRLNIAAFSTKYKNMQIGVLAGGFFSFENAGDATINGAEFELRARPTPSVELAAGVGYLDARFDSVTPQAIAAGVLRDNDLPMTPEWTFNAGIQWTPLTIAAGKLTTRLDYSYVSERRSFANTAPGNVLDSRSLVNARVAWESASGEWTLAVSARNLFDEEYLNFAEDVRRTASPLGVWNVFPAPPREIFGEVAYRF